MGQQNYDSTQGQNSLMEDSCSYRPSQRGARSLYGAHCELVHSQKIHGKRRSLLTLVIDTADLADMMTPAFSLNGTVCLATYRYPKNQWSGRFGSV